MLQSSELIARIRSVALGLTGVICIAYATLALATGVPDPISPWLPAVVGVVASAAIFVAFVLSDRSAGEIATDELYVAQNRRALAFGYWGAVALYPVFGLLIALDQVSTGLALPVMGTLTGAAYLIPHAILTGWR